MRQGDVTVDKEYKDSTDLHIPYQLTAPHVQNYMSALQDVLTHTWRGFLSVRPLVFKWSHYLCSGILKVVDSSSGIPKGLMLCLETVYRHLVFMTYLNDVPDGGTEWYYQQRYVPAQRGYTVIWPADWTFHHRGRVSNTEEKMIITGWFNFV